MFDEGRMKQITSAAIKFFTSPEGKDLLTAFTIDTAEQLVTKGNDTHDLSRLAGRMDLIDTIRFMIQVDEQDKDSGTDEITNETYN